METETRVDGLVGRWEEMRDHGTPLTVAELCAGCPELFAEVRRRIEVLQAMDPALDTGVTDLLSTPGDRAGGAGPSCELTEVLRAPAVYRLRRHHDHGGLGVVFTAHQEDLDRTVALKRIRPDKLREVARRRFLREAALTARLQHPGIVPIYGLGEADGGPFYTMPFIRGQTLQTAIDAFHGEDSPGHDPGRRRLRFRGLLQQFITACNTVAYAHDQGVVHRDLKPSNIMLGPYGETLVMDWGLAKRCGGAEAAGEDAGDAPSPSPSPGDMTATGEILGTPQYMSPEQARGEPAEPAGDIFSLGLVLYAILTGRSAFDAPDSSVVDRLKAVRAAAIVPPRGRDPRLPRALEAICLKALAARAEDRYPSGRALADDLTSWLADEPVTAWREPLSVRARRWARRHRTAGAAATVALLAGILGLAAVAGVQAQANVRLNRANDATNAALAQSEDSRKQAEAVSNFLVEAFRSPDPSQDGLEVKVADVLDRAGDRLDKEFSGSLAIKGTLLDTLGLTYRGLGLYEKAANLHAKARAVRESELGPDHSDTLVARDNLAVALAEAGRLPRAIPLFEETLGVSQATLGRDHPDTLKYRDHLGKAYLDAGRLSKAVPLLEATLGSREVVLGRDHLDTLSSRNSLACAYLIIGRTGDAIKLIEETLQRRKVVLGPDHLATRESRSNLAIGYRAVGRTSEAIALDEVTLRQREAKMGPDHPDTLKSRSNLAIGYRAAGLASAPRTIELDEGTLRLRLAKLGPDHPDTLQSRTNLAIDYWAAGRASEAIELMETTLEIEQVKLGPDHPDTLMSRNNLAAAYQEAGRASEAIPLHEEVLKVRETKLGPDHLHTLMSRINLALAYQEAGRTSQAIALHESTLKRSEAKPGPDHPYTFECRNGLAATYESLRRWPEGERLYRDSLARRRQAVPPDSPLLAGDLARLARNLLEQSQFSEAELHVREALAIHEKANPDDWGRYDTMSLLGGALLGQGRQAEAEPLVLAGYQEMKAREARIAVPEKFRLREAAERVIHLYETANQPEKASACKTKLGMPDLPADVFARP